MSNGTRTARVAELGDIDPAGSRQLGRRSAVCWLDEAIAAGLADGTVAAFDPETLDARWRTDGDGDGSVVTLAPFADAVLIGERGHDGLVRLLDASTGEEQWRHRTADVVGEPQQETRFFLPFVVDAVTDGERAYVAARRYERGSDGERRFRSTVFAVEVDGTVAWRYRTDASPISLDTDGERVAVAHNRCPGSDQDGLVILDSASGAVQRQWDPPGDGDRRVGDVSLLADGVVVASHADYRGYRLGDEGVRWSVDLGRPVDRGEETVYTYPNHVHATDEGVVFLTGNTYPQEGREADSRHPAEHAATGVGSSGERRWQADVGGFSHEIDAVGDLVAVPVAQHFRDRDPSVHGVRRLDVAEGPVDSESTSGVATAVAIGDERIASVEEPVAYHDEDDIRGAYRIRTRRVSNGTRRVPHDSSV